MFTTTSLFHAEMAANHHSKSFLALESNTITSCQDVLERRCLNKFRNSSFAGSITFDIEIICPQIRATVRAAAVPDFRHCLIALLTLAILS